jgi:hypothetical protein
MNESPLWTWGCILLMFVLAVTGWIVPFVVLMIYALMLAMALAIVYASIAIWFPPRRKL